MEKELPDNRLGIFVLYLNLFGLRACWIMGLQILCPAQDSPLSVQRVKNEDVSTVSNLHTKTFQLGFESLAFSL